MRESHLYFEGRLAYSFGKNGKGLTDEFDTLNELIKLLGKDNFITIHKTFIDQVDDVYDLIFDLEPKESVEHLMEDEVENS